MKYRIDTPLKIVIPILVIVAVLILWLLPWQCSQAQTAGSFNMDFPYSSGVDKAMTKAHGAAWIADYVKPQLREAWKNHKNAGLERYKASMSELFSEDIHPDDLLKTEANKLQQIADSAAARKARRLQREADSLAAIRPTGDLIHPDSEQDANENGTLYVGKQTSAEYLADLREARNIGRAYSPRSLFMEAITPPGTKGGGGSFGHGYSLSTGEKWTIAAVLIGTLIVAGVTIYAAYHGVKWVANL